jgi:hypothetical protein
MRGFSSLPSTSGRWDSKLQGYAVEVRYCGLRHPQKKARLQTQAQLGATMTFESDSSPGAADTLEKPKALEHVKRINPKTDKFEVRHHYRVAFMQPCTSGYVDSLILASRSSSFTTSTGGVPMRLQHITGQAPRLTLI